MPPRINKELFQQLMEFERGRIIGLKRRIFQSRNRSWCAAEQFHSDGSLEALVDQRAPNSKTSSGRRKVTSARDDRYLLRMGLNDRNASSRHLVARWSTATAVLMSASSIHRRPLHRGFRAKVLLYRILLTANHRWLRLQ
ncbi:UNVERIFIED_CONTAM: hypothetical protein NCL1_44208 [Trichonephila clavipes]